MGDLRSWKVCGLEVTAVDAPAPLLIKCGRKLKNKKSNKPVGEVNSICEATTALLNANLVGDRRSQSRDRLQGHGYSHRFFE